MKAVRFIRSNVSSLSRLRCYGVHGLRSIRCSSVGSRPSSGVSVNGNGKELHDDGSITTAARWDIITGPPYNAKRRNVTKFVCLVNGYKRKESSNYVSTCGVADSTSRPTNANGDVGFGFPAPEFANTRLIYASKSTAELFRAYLVFTACSFDFLVNNQAKVCDENKSIMLNQVQDKYKTKTKTKITYVGGVTAVSDYKSAW